MADCSPMARIVGFAGFACCLQRRCLLLPVPLPPAGPPCPIILEPLPASR